MKTIAYVRAANIYDDSRATKEITALAEAGYEVCVLAWDRNGKAKESCERVFQTYTDQIRFSFFSEAAENGIGMKNISKLLRWILWVSNTLGMLKELRAVHACDLDGGLGAFAFCKRTRIPLVYDIYDYYIDSHPVPGLLMTVIEKMEIAIINHAAATIICTEERRAQIAKARPNGVLVLHNSPDVGSVREPEANVDYVYCGAMGERRLLKEIMDAYEAHQDLTFTFAGYGGHSGQAAALAEKYENFSFLGTVSYDRVLEVEAGATAIAAIYEPTVRNHKLCAPNKFYEALALSKPVIVCRGTGIDRIVEENGIGVVIDYDAGQFYDALAYLKKNPQVAHQMGKRGRELYEKKYTWTKMAQLLIDMYETLTG